MKIVDRIRDALARRRTMRAERALKRSRGEATRHEHKRHSGGSDPRSHGMR